MGCAAGCEKSRSSAQLLSYAINYNWDPPARRCQFNEGCAHLFSSSPLSLNVFPSCALMAGCRARGCRGRGSTGLAIICWWPRDKSRRGHFFGPRKTSAEGTEIKTGSVCVRERERPKFPKGTWSEGFFTRSVRQSRAWKWLISKSKPPTIGDLAVMLLKIHVAILDCDSSRRFTNICTYTCMYM